MKILWSGVVAFVLVLFPLTPACAQAQRPLHVSVAGGASRDVLGNFEGSRNGAHASLMFERSWDRFTLRSEAMYSRFRPERETLVCAAGIAIVGPCPSFETRNEVASLMLSGTAGTWIGRTRIYGIAGTGVYRYRVREEVTVDDPCPGVACAAAETMTTVEENTSANFGVNFGLGALWRVGSVGVFAEARYHHLVGGGRDHGILPLSVGLRF